jgi:molybdopterin converting factor subunit 1
VKILYFAWLRQKIGKSEEQLALPAGITSVGGLAVYLAGLGPGYAEAFADVARLCAAVNQSHAGFDAPIAEDDEIAFFPPVTGG